MGQTVIKSKSDAIDIKGSLETISNLALLGMLCVDMEKEQFIPTLIEDIYGHSQRLVEEYAKTEDSDGSR